MNANEMASEAVSMVAPQTGKGFRVDVVENKIIVQLVRDSFESEKFNLYKETLNHIWDALSAIKNCRFNRHGGGGVEILRSPGRSNARAELYTCTYEVFTKQEVQAQLAQAGISL